MGSQGLIELSTMSNGSTYGYLFRLKILFAC